MLYVSHEENNIRVLGPGLRYVVWVQGCRKRCRGCVFPAGWPERENGYWRQTAEIMEALQSSPSLTGITVSGGEPFLQTDGLSELVREIRRTTVLDIMVYSGYRLEELQARQDAAIDYILNNIDLLVDGEYREELNTNKIYRGSDNQVIHFLSDKYKPWQELIRNTVNRSIEFIQRGDDLFIAGIPAKGFSRDFWAMVNKREE